MRPPNTRIRLLSKLATSLVGTEPLELARGQGRGSSRRGRGSTGGRCREGRWLRGSTGLALAVPLVDKDTSVPRDTGRRARPVLTAALGPGTGLSSRASRQSGDGTGNDGALHLVVEFTWSKTGWSTKHLPGRRGNILALLYPSSPHPPNNLPSLQPPLSEWRWDR